MNNLPDFIRHKKSLLQEIRRKFKISGFGRNEDLYINNKKINYNVATCPGSSGAKIFGFKVKVTSVEAIHHGGHATNFNVGLGGFSKQLNQERTAYGYIYRFEEID